MSEERAFTEDEANSLLAEISESLHRIQEAREVILAGAEHIRRSATLDGGGQVSQEYWDALQEMRRHLESFAAQGILLRDTDSGLVDFPARRDGRDVFLCWRLGEERVGYWHPPETGFAGRRPL